MYQLIEIINASLTKTCFVSDYNDACDIAECLLEKHLAYTKANIDIDTKDLTIHDVREDPAVANGWFRAKIKDRDDEYAYDIYVHKVL